MSIDHPQPPQARQTPQARLHAYLFSTAQTTWPATSALLGHTPTPRSLEILPGSMSMGRLPDSMSMGRPKPVPGVGDPGVGNPGVGNPGVGDLVLVLTTPEGGTIHAVVSGPLARGLVGLLLDEEDANGAPPPPTPLSAAEAGLLAGLTVAVLQDLDLSTLGLQDVAVVRDENDPPYTLPTDWALGCHLALGCGPTGGRLVLLMDTAATSSLRESVRRWRPPPSQRGADLPLAADLVLARTELVWSRLTDLEPGDAIVFPCPAPPDDHWPIHLAVADLLFPATLRRTHNGREVEIKGTSMDPTDASDPSISSDPSLSSDPIDQSPDQPARGDLLDRLPVTLTAVLGRVELTAGDVARLAPGVVIALEHPVGGTVALRAGSRPVGVGELVEVDGSLGVRLTELTL